MKKFKLTKETITHFGRTLYRIEALIDFSTVIKGEKGGYIEKESNLGHHEDAWISGNARVYGNAWISGKVEGAYCLSLQQFKHNITVTDNYIFIGCEGHTWGYWEKNINYIGEKNNYSQKEIKEVSALLEVLKRQITSKIGENT